VRRWDVDEFEHLQFAWMISQGMVPYRDFFEHHTPLVHFLAAPWFFVFTDAHGLVSVVPVLFRAFSTLCSLLTAGIVWLLAARIVGRRAALFAAVLLLGDSLFLAKGIEFRPDTLAALAMMASAYALLRAADRTPPSRTWLIGAGFALVLAVLSTQKLLFAGPGCLVVFFLVIGRRFGAAGAIQGAGWVAVGAIAAAAPLLG
jgi:4-amino-4-deoxy-L-arabinose transferase-like glycosyltransferase